MPEISNKNLKIIKSLLLLVIYCIPCIIAIIVTLSINYNRSLNSVEPIHAYMIRIRDGKEIQEDIIANNLVSKRLVEFFKAKKQLDYLKYDKNNIREIIINGWRTNSVFISVLTLFPFVIFGSGLAFKWVERKSLAELIRIAHKNWPIKYIVGFVISVGWLYVFNPFGQGASAVYGFVAFEDIISTDTLPFYVDYKAQMKHTVAGFLGFYLHLVGYFFYRLYKGDVLGTNIYVKLFSKFMFVFGVSLILSAVTTNEALIVIFLIGFFPLSAMSILKEFSIKKVSGVSEQSTSLSLLPGISRWHILRLEEENIDSIPTLATVDPDKLINIIPEETIDPKLILHWIDVSKFIVVLGIEKYLHLEGVCKTASYFIAKSSNEQFKETLSKDYHIANPDEIKKILCTTYSAK